MINGHGDDTYKYPEKVKHNFSSNVFYKGCNKGLLNEIKDKVFTIENYPSPAANELNKAAANYFNVSESQFLFGNGATELFYLIGQLYSGKTATIIGPTFSEYEDACKMHNIAIEFLSWRQIKDKFTSDLVFICNPNNPTGDVLKTAQIEQLLINAPESQFIIDEAYVEFTDKDCSSMELLSKYQNLVIVKSLTKTFAVPGIRLGYVVSNTDFIQKLLAYKLPWTVNVLAIAAGLYIYKNYETLLFSASELIQETKEFQKEINSISNLKVQESNTSYFLVEVKKGTASSLKEFLMHNHQILVRDATNFTLLEGEYIRLAVQSKESNNAILKALNEWN